MYILTKFVIQYAHYFKFHFKNIFLPWMISLEGNMMLWVAMQWKNSKQIVEQQWKNNEKVILI